MRVACCLSACLLIVACGESGVVVDTTAETFCEEIAEVYCHNMYQCCTEREIEQRLGVSEPRSELECRQDITRDCIRDSAPVMDSLRANRVTFDPVLMNTCLNAILAPPNECAAVVMEAPWKEACKDSPFIGQVAVGGACFYNVDCAGAPDTAECAPTQRCVALPTAGFPCVNGSCAADFFCGTNAICQPKLAAGAPCTGLNQCQEELFCDFTSITPTCVAQQGAGAACTSDAQCLSTECVPGQCRGSTAMCYTDANCTARCANSTLTCLADYQCNTATPGHCDVTTSVSCSGSTADSQCVSASAGTRCIFNVACVPGDCVGDPVCTAPLSLVDYCTATSMQLTP